jgi:ubiquitin C-terminal hydrolase
MPCLLENMGNTCALNSILQCFIHTDMILDSLTNFQESSTASSTASSSASSTMSVENKDSRISNQLKDVLIKMKNHPNAVMKPKGFISIFFKTYSGIFVQGRQLDACESLMMIQQTLFKEIGEKIEASSIKPEDYSVAQLEAEMKRLTLNNMLQSNYQRLNEGMLLNITLCGNCKTKHHNFETFTQLSVGFDDNGSAATEPISIKKLIEKYFEKSENISGWKCSNCNSIQNCINFTNLWSLPDILTITVKRFDNNLKKKHFDININKELNFPEKSQCNDPAIGVKYGFKSAILHHGVFQGGHYTSIVYNQDSDELYHLDDTNYKNFGENSTKVLERNSEAYILFYQKLP